MTRSLVRVLAVLATATLLLGACGNDDESATPTDTTEAPERDETKSPDLDGDDDSDVITTTTAPTTPVELPNPAELDDFCEVMELFNETDRYYDDIDPLQTDPAAMMGELFVYLSGVFTRAAQVAPGEIRADMTVLADAVRDYVGLLAEYEFDEEALERAAEDDPRLEARIERMESDEFNEIADRIEVYVLDECGVDLS